MLLTLRICFMIPTLDRAALFPYGHQLGAFLWQYRPLLTVHTGLTVS